MRRFLLTLALACSVALPALAQKPLARKVRPPADPYASAAWLLEYSKGTTLVMTADGPSFAFPTKKQFSANLLTKGWTGTDGGTLVITLRLVTTGAPVFQLAQGPEPCSNPPAARAFFATNDWKTTILPEHEWNRWWSRTGFLALGSGGVFTFTAPLDPAQWSNVNGILASRDSFTISQFWRVLLQGGRIGLVFGGGCSYGHGLYVTGGTAVLTVLAYDVVL